MEEETVTFEIIRKVQREEQRSPKLTKLPEGFYEGVVKYLERKRETAKRLEDRKVSIEIKNVERLVEDIFNRRERKIVNFAINSARTGLPVENLTEEEKKLFDEILKLLKKRRDSFFEMVKKTGEEAHGEIIMFKEDVPEFVGSDGKTYGPFKKGDVAKIPEDNAKVFIERGVAEKIKI